MADYQNDLMGRRPFIVPNFRTPPFIPPGVFAEREQQQEGEQAQPTQQFTPPAPVSAGDFSYDETPAQMAAAPRGEQSPMSTTSRPSLSDEAAKRLEEMLRTKPKRSWLGTVGALASGAAAGYLNATGKFNQRFGMDPEAQREMAFPGHAEGLKRAQMAAQLEHQKNQEALTQQQRETQDEYYKSLIENQRQANQDRAAARTGAETARLARIAEDAKKTKLEASDWETKRIEAGGTVYTPPPPVTLSPSMYPNQERGSIPPTVQDVSENLPAMPTTRSSIPPAFTVQEPEPDNVIESPYTGRKFVTKSKLITLPISITESLGMKEGTEIPTTELDSYVKIYETKTKNPSLKFDTFTNDKTGDATVIGRNNVTGEEQFRQVISGVAEKRPAVSLQSFNGGLSREAFDRVTKLGTSYKTEPAVRNYNDVLAAIRSIERSADTALKDNTGASDITLLRQFAKLTDPTTGVREEEYRTMQAAGGVWNAVQLYANGDWLKGKRLTPELRKEFKRVAQEVAKIRQDAYRKTQESYTRKAIASGVDPTLVITDIDPPTQTPAGTGAVEEWVRDASGKLVRKN